MHYREYIQATGINLIFTFCIYLYYPIISPYIKSIGLDDFQTALIFSILPLVTIFSSPIMGRLSDEVGRLWVIILGLIIEIAAMCLYLMGNSWLLLVVARLLDAVAFAAVTLVAIAKIEDALSEKERGKYAGWSFSFAHIGAIVAPVVGGVLADRLFVRAPFLLTAILLLLLAFFLAFRTRKNQKKPTKSTFNMLAEIKSFWSIKSLRGMGILGIVMHATNPAMSVFLPLYIIEKMGLSYSYVGIALFFLGVTNLFQFYFGSLSDKFGRATMTLFGCLVFALFLFLLSTTKTFWVLLVFLFFQGLGGGIWNISAWSFMSGIGERIRKEGEVIGSYMSIAKTGSFVSFIFSGLIVQIFGIEVLFMFNAFLIAIGLFASSFYIHQNLSDKNTKNL